MGVNKNRLKILVGIRSKPVKLLIRLKDGHQAQNLATFHRFFFSPIRYFITWNISRSNLISNSFSIERVCIFRSSPPELFLGKGVLKIRSKFTGQNQCRSVISMKLQINFIDITLRHGCSPLNLLHIFRTPFPKNTSGWLPVYFRNLFFKYLDTE